MSLKTLISLQIKLFHKVADEGLADIFPSEAREDVISPIAVQGGWRAHEEKQKKRKYRESNDLHFGAEFEKELKAPRIPLHHSYKSRITQHVTRQEKSLWVFLWISWEKKSLVAKREKKFRGRKRDWSS